MLWVTKALYVAGGTISLITGVIGIFLPVLPTVPFILLAAAFYFKGSKRMYNLLMKNRYFGKYIRFYKRGGVISPRLKVYTLIGIWGGSAISGTFFVHTIMLRLVVFSTALITTIYILLTKGVKIKKAL